MGCPLVDLSKRAAFVALALPLVLAGCMPPGVRTIASGSPSGIEKVQHIVIIMQENRSFDSYFGTYPGADGIPMTDGVPTVCLHDPLTNTCVRPYHDPKDSNHGGPHGHTAALTDIDNGRMDGFIRAQRLGETLACPTLNEPSCAEPDVMGWHDAREIPNYWSYAENFVLEDHMFEPTTSWSLPAHLFMVSAWSASCTTRADPESCSSEIENPPYQPDYQEGLAPPDQRPPITTPDYAWTDLTYLLHAHNVSWAYYIEGGNEPDCADDQMVCPPILQSNRTPGIWNPLPWFDTVRDDNQLNNVQDLSNFLAAATDGNLPAVSWIIPNAADSEVPPASIRRGQAHVTNLINTVMQGPDWDSTAIFLAWDDWSGFYDHVVPPVVDDNGYGLRVPGLLISPYARRGLIDHQVLSFDAYLKFIEDRFLGGQRLDPASDSRPDSRPDVREAQSQLGDLRSEFDFTQAPLPPLVLPVIQ